MPMTIDFNEQYEITDGPLKGIKGDAIDFDKITGIVELAIGSEVSMNISVKRLRKVKY